MSRVIDTTRTVTFDQPFLPDVPGWCVVIFDPVLELNTGNGYDIWPNMHETQDGARREYLEAIVADDLNPQAAEAAKRELESL